MQLYLDKNQLEKVEDLYDDKENLLSRSWMALERLAISYERREKYKDAIDIAKIAGFEKLIMPQQMPVTAQIPLQNAVPRYFFGYAVLEQEKKQIETNANDETKIPGYSAFVSENSRLAAMSDFIVKADLNFVDVQIFPKVEVKNGLVTKLAVIIAATLLLISMSCLVIALRIFKRKMAS